MAAVVAHVVVNAVNLRRIAAQYLLDFAPRTNEESGPEREEVPRVVSAPRDQPRIGFGERAAALEESAEVIEFDLRQ